MFARVLETSLGDVDKKSSCRKFSLFGAKRLLYRPFLTRAKFQGNLFLRDLPNSNLPFICSKSTIKTLEPSKKYAQS